MANTGLDLINAIVANQTLMGLDNCPGVSAQMSCAVYGSVQDDSGKGTDIQNNSSMQKDINIAVGFGGANSETAVWHFLVTSSSPIHHFVVVPWYKSNIPQGQVYTVFMAYEINATNKYSVGDYVHGTGNFAPAPGGTGYKTEWSVNQLSTMLSDLLTSPTAWQNYFGNVGAAQATKITYWKYKITTLTSAISNVNAYNRLCT